ncbi:hypothetical protein E0Z10_g2113 [Xylaria hypoxylon]|uniref:Uncharacterized protein n=1 Tax=Xylaria hypoxylon TaxID=37992 RepID=A0A4Z0YQN3_9PEZI|nr:hypothetical protein E0Z10_g2113 [Xylaria hypoxylon]
MPPIQNTFSIIPDVPSAIGAIRHGNGDSTNARPRPPMTTKQVKKAYQKANKGPKLSKAEQRRQELFEQDRIRKEFEKEKNQARARAARDKKKEKEERERAEKKKKGLPLVNVRASQDTIARFVRAKPQSQRGCNASPLPATGAYKDERESWSVSPRHHDSGGSGQIRQFDDTDKENVRPPEQFEKASPQLRAVTIDNSCGLGSLGSKSPVIAPVEPPYKKRRIDVLDEKEEEDETHFLVANGVVSPPSKPNRKVSVAGDYIEGTPCPDAEQGGLNINDSFSTIDFSEEELLDDLLRKTESIRGTPNAPHKRISSQQQGQSLPTKSLPPKPPEYENHVPSPEESPPRLERTAMPTKSLLSPHQAIIPPESILDTANISGQNPIPDQARQASTPYSVIVPPSFSVQKPQPIAPSLRSFRHPRTPMAPPPVPPKFKSSKVSASHPRTPQFLKPPPHTPRIPIGGSCHSRMTKSKQSQDNQLPPSTQLFILSHFDDFLPSPSQEVWEIFEEPKGKHYGIGSQAEMTARYTGHKTLRSSPPVSEVPATPYNRSMISTPDVTLGGSRHIQQIADHPERRRATLQPPIQPIPLNTACTFEMPFFSTQDLFLSSQDVKDIEADPLPLPKAQVPNPITPKPCIKPQDQPRPSPKQFFTSSCRETRYEYMIERNKTAAWESPSDQHKAREELGRLQTVEHNRLLADPTEQGKEKREAIAIENYATKPGAARKESPITQLHSTPTPQVQPSQPYRPSRLARLDSSDRSVRNLMPSSGSLPENTAQTHARKPPDAQRSRPGSSSSGKSQRNTRPKGSYEAMLELLAKRPTPPQEKQRSSAPNRDTGKNGDRGDGAGYTEKNQTTTEEYHAVATTIPASQETDYDCGGEWDDDDLLCDML